MELINYPTPRRERRAVDNGNTDVAAIGIVHNERGRSLSREDQGGRHHRDGGARHSPLPLPSLSLLLPLRLFLVRRLVVALMPPHLILSTLSLPLHAQPRPIEALLPLVHWRLSSRLPLVCRLVVTSPRASALCHLSLRSRHTHPSLTPPLCSRQLVVTSHLFAPPPPLHAPPPHNWLCCRRCQCTSVNAQASLPSSRLRLSPLSQVVKLALSPSSSITIVIVSIWRHSKWCALCFVLIG